ncbi:hypothetical protein JW721_02200 [Candidatus Micrarchaeota archaeon]|nr:hypothetical protein [Candidatus Micrarchaeota archaeon]
MAGKNSKSNGRNRIGPKERGRIQSLRNALKNYKFEKRDACAENPFVDKIRSSLIQKAAFKDLKRRNIGPVAEILGKKYIPDLVLPGRGNLLAVEFKILKGNATSDDISFKEGIAQAVINRIKYKYVMLVLVDISKEGKHRGVDKRSSPNYTRLYNKLKGENIEIVPMGPTKR